MSNYLRHLVSRNLNLTETVQPRLASLFEPAQKLPGVSIDADFDLPSTEEPTEVPVVQDSVAFGQRSPSPLTAAPRPQPIPVFPSPTDFVAEPASSHQLAPRNESPPVPPTAAFSPPSSALSRSSIEPISLALPKPQVEPTVIHKITDRVITERILPVERSTDPPQPPSSLVAHALNNEQSSSVQPLISDRVTPDRSQSENSSSPVAQPVLAPSPSREPIVPVIRTAAPLPVPALASPQPTPTIQVTIGRIEIRATPPAAPPTPRSRPTPPVMSLEDYLRQRGGQR